MVTQQKTEEVAAQVWRVQCAYLWYRGTSEADSESDIDLLVNMEPGRSLLDLNFDRSLKKCLAVKWMW